jgi:hypothetical protein
MRRRATAIEVSSDAGIVEYDIELDVAGHCEWV